jgi:hypothetical protein
MAKAKPLNFFDSSHSSRYFSMEVLKYCFLPENMDEYPDYSDAEIFLKKPLSFSNFTYQDVRFQFYIKNKKKRYLFTWNSLRATCKLFYEMVNKKAFMDLWFKYAVDEEFYQKYLVASVLPNFSIGKLILESVTPKMKASVIGKRTNSKILMERREKRVQELEKMIQKETSQLEDLIKPKEGASKTVIDNFEKAKKKLQKSITRNRKEQAEKNRQRLIYQRDWMKYERMLPQKTKKNRSNPKKQKIDQ